MSTGQHHIIEKQTLEITFPGVGAALDWENNHQQQFVNAVQKTLDRCFGAYDNENRHIIIDKLEVDLGIFTESNFQNEVPERLFAALQKKLAASARDLSTNEWQSYQGNFATNAQQHSDRVYSGAQGRLESFLFFLQRGSLPWWGSALAGWDEGWLKNLSAREWSAIKIFLSAGDPNSIPRLIQQFDDPFLEVLIEGISNTTAPVKPLQWILSLMDQWEEKYLLLIEKAGRKKLAVYPNNNAFLSKPVSPKLIRQRYWSKWMRHVLGIEAVPQLKELFFDNEPLLDFIKMSFQNDGATVFSNDQIPLSWQAELNKPGAFTGNNYQSPAHDNAGANQSNRLLNPPDEFKNELTKKLRLSDPADKLYVTDAGLVLLHPFLPQLFRNCGLADENSFIDAASQTMAVYAVHYLVTDSVVVPEYQLLLPKLFCGMDREEPLHPIDLLPQICQEACDDLLIEVIGHWTALKNTSPDGLRQAFLQRNGKLETQQFGWQLLVEEKAQDVLLGRLPWGISIIKYPWMSGMLSVNWK